MKSILKKILFGGLAAALVFGLLPADFAFAASSEFAGEAWYDQLETVEINREAAHSSFIPYESAEKALENEKSVLDDMDASGSEYYQLLNGTWSFYFSSNVTERLKNVTGSSAVNYTENWDTTGWDTIEVPSNIQTQTNEDGSYKYDTPIYTNQTYAWSNYETVNYTTAPTTNNSVGQYKRTFTLPDSWDGRQVFVSFQGVQSAFYVYINGQMVGYGEDSYTADEFNITPYLQEGENTIAVEVYRWSTGSYLENQDYIDMSGIFRDVYLYSKDDVEIRDIFATTDLNDDYTQATVNVSVDVKNLAAESGDYTVEAQLYDADDNAVWNSPISMTATVEDALTDVAELADDTGVTVSASMEVDNPEMWFADTPYLYRLLVQLKDSDGDVLENAVIRIGIREVGTATINSAGQQQIQINGQKVLLRGVNRHESSAENGRALTNEEILTDVQLMKSFNINAIRTSHYPNNTYLYDLADELGLYICDEANIESHLGAIYSNIPSGDSAWNTSVMDRTMNMVERDKNHASVIIWSLGNESTYSTYTMDESYCFYNSSQWILERDPSRLRKYERDNRYTEGSREESMVDLYSSQYWSVDSVISQLENTGNKLPYIQSEYAHSMGNGLGNLAEYWEVFREYDNANGGFIWDWIDQALYAVNEDGETYLAYGGDWGETVTDEDFCANGMVNADRTPSAELYEAKKVLQEISFYDDGNIEEGEVRIVNEFLNTNLNEYQVTWTYTEDNTVIASGELTGDDIDIAAGESKTIQVSLPDVIVTEGSDYVLTFSVTLKEDTAWASEYGGKAGDEIAFEQFELELTSAESQPSMDASSMNEMTVKETDTSVAFTGTTENGEDYSIAIDKTTGYITDYTVDGTALLTSGPEPNYWRAATSNDAGAGVAGVDSNLKDAADYYTISDVTVEQHDKVVYVTISGVISNTNSEETLQYAVYADGSVTVTNTFTPSSSCDTLSRVGMKMTVAAGMETVTYYGKGAQANYSDRNTGAKLGVYSTTVSDMFESKLVNPQENGNRTGTRWVSLMDDENQIGLLISAEDAMEFTALHYTAEDMAESSHPYELTELDETILTVDYAQRGLGNASCGPDTLSEYQLPTDTTYTHTYSIRPITGTTSTSEDFVDSCMELSNLNVNSAEPISAITVDGESLEDFQVDTSDYTYERAYTDGMTSPVIGVITTSDDVEVSIEQIDGYSGTATITATSAYGVTSVYTVTVSTVQREYLSDMEWTENVSGYFTNSRDTCDSNPIQLSVDGKTITYSKGVGMHAPASVTVDISGLGYTTFSAVAGINYESVSDNNGYSNVNLVVLVDGEEAFRADNIGYNSDGNVFSVPVEVDVTGANTVTVKVEQGDYDYNDHVSWANARFTATVEEPGCSHESAELVNAKEPTCTEDGYTGDTVCTICGETVSAGEVIPATGHSYVSETVRAATCTEDGEVTYTCSVCGSSYTEEISATGHSWDAGVVTKEATTEEEGEITYTCTVCGETKTETIEKLAKELLVPNVSLTVTADSSGHLVLTGVYEDYANSDEYYTVTSHGFIYYSTTKLGNRVLSVNTSGRTRVNFSKYTSSGSYTYTMTPANGNTKYTIRAFLAYTNGDGKTVYVYSDPISVTYNSLSK